MVEDRTVRRFDNARGISRDTLLELVELVRFCASGRNAQPLRYRLVCSREECAALYPILTWAGYYKDWDGPEPAERPAAYLVQCLDTELGQDCLCDDGLQLEAITLGARALGIGSCIIKAFDAVAAARELGIPERYRLRYVLALGYPAETPVIVDMEPEGDFRYYRDGRGVHYVPKRKLQHLLIP